jgi:hypothetical protein
MFQITLAPHEPVLPFIPRPALVAPQSRRRTLRVKRLEQQLGSALARARDDTSFQVTDSTHADTRPLREPLLGQPEGLAAGQQHLPQPGSMTYLRHKLGICHDEMLPAAVMGSPSPCHQAGSAALSR